MKTTTTTIALVLAAVSGAAMAAGTDTPAPQGNNVCFQPTHIKNTVPISDREVLFYMADGKIWKNTLRNECHGLKFEGGFSWEIRGDTVCSNAQVIKVLHTGMPCFLGDFTAYTPPPKPQE